jgi:hypothetical protein
MWCSLRRVQCGTSRWPLAVGPWFELQVSDLAFGALATSRAAWSHERFLKKRDRNRLRDQCPCATATRLDPTFSFAIGLYTVDWIGKSRQPMLVSSTVISYTPCATRCRRGTVLVNPSCFYHLTSRIESYLTSSTRPEAPQA